MTMAPSAHELWERMIKAMGGEGLWPEKVEPEGEVGAKFPMRMVKGLEEVLVLDEEEEEMARSHGYRMIGEKDAAE